MTLRLLTSLLASAIALLSAPSAAHAGSYDVLACDAAPGGVNRTWTPENTDGVHMETGTACPSSSSYNGMYARTRLNSGGPTTGSRTQWIFRAPSGTTISRVWLVRWLGMESGSGWRPFGRQADGLIVPGETCFAGSGSFECNVGGYNTAPVDYSVATNSIAYGIECIGNGGCSTGSSIHAARAAIYSARVTLSESTAPTVSVPTGALVTESGYHRGTEAATFTGSDPTTGISAQRIYIDGIERASTALPCDYTYALPCSNPTGDRTLSVDLAATSGGSRVISDGTHTVQVAAVDAAGNETRAPARSIVVDATAPAAPSALATSIGSSWQTSRDFTATWTQPSGHVAPIDTAHWRFCPAGSTTSCVTGSAPVSASSGTLSGLQVPGEGEWDFSVRLQDAAGNTAPGNVARTTVRYDATAPAATPDLHVSSIRKDTDPQFFAFFNPPAGQASPIAQAPWTLCPLGSTTGCRSGTLHANPNGTNFFTETVPSHGDWTLSVRLRDQAGNLGPAATTNLRYSAAPIAPTPTPTATPTPASTPTPPPTVRESAAVSLHMATLHRTRRLLIVRGTAAKTATGRVAVNVRIRRDGRTHTVSKLTAVDKGRFAVRLRLSQRDARGRLSVRAVYRGSSTHAPDRTAPRVVRVR